jgi:hypothetical protein
MDLQLLNELQESRLYRTTDGFKPYKKEDIAELLMITTMMVYMFAHDTKYKPFAIQYANASVRHGKFRASRLGANDLYMIAYTINSKYKKNYKFNDQLLHQFMIALAKGQLPNALYFLRLQRQLKINDMSIQNVRRLISDWPKLKYRQKQLAVTKMLHIMRAKAVRSDLYKTLNKFAKERNYKLANATNKELDKTTNQTTLKRLAVAGASAYVGAEFGPRITGGRLGPKSAAGLAGVAAYWQSRKRS